MPRAEAYASLRRLEDVLREQGVEYVAQDQ